MDILFKNVAGQKLAVAAWDGANSTWKTGDAANITAQISIDGAACAATNDVNPTELDAVDAPGTYIFDLLQADTNGDLIIVHPVSSTSNIVFRPVYARTTLLTPTVAGYLDKAISAIETSIIAEVNVNEGKIDALNDISVANIIAGIADGAYDLQEMIRIIFAIAVGKATGGGTTSISFRDSADSKDRAVMTVNSKGTRSAVTLDGS